ncbi:MAG TPA: sugar transferase [Thermomicrobiales bacterium]|jgi:lipopolysaccharide/colanic/teichoic acid biosynthesis glycosyltransferase
MQRTIQPAITWAQLPTRRLYRYTKRAIDLVGALVLLIVLAPVFAFCALAVRRSSPGPIFFRQERVGLRGQTFAFLKFRSMYVEADTTPHREYVAAFIRGEAPVVANADAADDGARDTLRVPLYKLGNDRRITPAGAWLRRTSLDELPQLWNVLRGEMSLVGPRPPIPYELEHYRPEQFSRLGVRPGITGLWQVSGRSRTTFEEMVALDLAYINEQSLRLDLLILLRTIPTVLACRDAR